MPRNVWSHATDMSVSVYLSVCPSLHAHTRPLSRIFWRQNSGQLIFFPAEVRPAEYFYGWYSAGGISGWFSAEFMARIYIAPLYPFQDLKMICNDFLVVKVNCSTSVSNIIKCNWILRKIKKNKKILEKTSESAQPDDLFTFGSNDVIPGKQAIKQPVECWMLTTDPATTQ